MAEIPRTADTPRTIEVDEFLPHPPHRVWRALTEPELLGRWLAPNDFALVVGHRFTFRMSPIPSSASTAPPTAGWSTSSRNGC